MMSNKNEKKSREELIEETLEKARQIRKKLDPKVLKAVREASVQQKPEEVKIDRKRNVKFVMDFLNSPEGAHLKSKIIS